MYRALAATLALLMIPAAVMAQSTGSGTADAPAPKLSPYNTAMQKAELYDQLGDTMLTGASAMVDTGSTAADICPYLVSSIDDWKKAAALYDEAAGTAPDAKDTDRKDAAALKDAHDFALQKAERGQGVVDGNCKAA